VTFAHIAGVPLEETVLAGGPAILAAVGATVTQIRARLRRRSTPS
jgi:hypothetical protein